MEIVAILQLILLLSLTAASALLFFSLRQVRRLLSKRNESAVTEA